MESFIFPLLLVLLVLPLFLSARRARRQQQEMHQLHSSLLVGDQVMTTSGLRGTIVSIDEDTIDLEIAPGVQTTWVKQAIREKVNPTNEAETDVVDETVENGPKADGR